MPYRVYDIKKSLIDECFKSGDLSQIEYIQFDKDCLHGELKIEEELVRKIYQTTCLNQNIDVASTKVNHTQYNIKKLYELDPHQDYCPITLIVYLNKYLDVQDEFWVDKKQVTEDRWNPQPNHYTALVLWSVEKDGQGPEHEGYFKGEGYREVMCFFLG